VETSSGEQNLRKFLPVARLMLAYVPLPVMRWVQTAVPFRLPAGVTRETVVADSVRCEWLIPENSRTDQVLLYLHGGGFVYGVTNLHREMVGQLARLTGLRTLMVDYRLAPEFPFPAALEDCIMVYRWLLRQGIDAQNITLAGDSAGGNLTLTTLIKLRDEGDLLPAGAACLSPATDLTVRHELERLHDPVLHRRALYAFREAYVADHDCTDPLLSPVYADLHGLPPLLIHAGEDEVLCADAIRIAELAQQAGVSARVEVYPRMWHVWHLYHATLPQAKHALEDIAQFLKAKVGSLAGQRAGKPA
jgi:acetyl esterase/lipase